MLLAQRASRSTEAGVHHIEGWHDRTVNVGASGSATTTAAVPADGPSDDDDADDDGDILSLLPPLDGK